MADYAQDIETLRQMDKGILKEIEKLKAEIASLKERLSKAAIP